ncbi:MAG: hypothetical protein KGQ75_11075 [Sphingomonadales bacterium]|nr:hypothetical protein [Sphingomonadales bacterium]
MTVPVTASLSSAAAPTAAGQVSPASTLPGAIAGEAADFAALLARDAPLADDALAAAAVPPALLSPALPSPARPAPLPQLVPEAEGTAADPGKALPFTRHKPAAYPLASVLGDRETRIAATPTAGKVAEAPAKDADKQPEPSAATFVPAPAALILPTPVAAAPGAATATSTATNAPAPPVAPPMSAPVSPPVSAAAPLTAEPRTQKASVAGAAHPAALAVANLVLEREAGLPAPATALPTTALPAMALPATASPQPAALAASGDGTALEQPALRAPRADVQQVQPAAFTPRTDRIEPRATRARRAEPDLLLPGAALAAPETASALALAQPAAPSSAASLPAPASASAATAPQPISFDQLVDSIARARDGAEQAGPVAVAMHHAEFGRISLRIEGDAAGLSVAMASPDPGFAPAVAAAHAAAAIPDPAPRSASENRADTLAQSQNQSGASTGTGTGQQRQPAQGGAAQRPAANPSRSPTSGAERRSGIFA